MISLLFVDSSVDFTAVSSALSSVSCSDAATPSDVSLIVFGSMLDSCLASALSETISKMLSCV